MNFLETTQLRRRLLTAVLGAALIPAIASAAPRRAGSDICLKDANGGSLNTFVFKNVDPLAPGQAIALQGLYFSNTRLSAFEGSAVMGSDGKVRLGIFVHASASPSSAGTFLNDFTMSGTTDLSFAGALNYDNDGDFLPNGTLPLQNVDCSTVVIP